MAMRNNEKRVDLFKYQNGTNTTNKPTTNILKSNGTSTFTSANTVVINGSSGGRGGVAISAIPRITQLGGGIKISDVFNRSKSDQIQATSVSTITFTTTTTTLSATTVSDQQRQQQQQQLQQRMTNGQQSDTSLHHPQHHQQNHHQQQNYNGNLTNQTTSDQLHLSPAYKMTESWPKAIFTCEANSHPFVRREVLIKDVVKIGRAIVGSKLASDNCLFDCRVLSRNHALLTYRDRKFLLKDTKSSNGTFLNNVRLSNPLEESGEFEVFSGDLIKFGVDISEEGKSANLTIYPSIIATLTLYHPDGSEAIKERVPQLNYDHTSIEVPSQQLVQLAHYVEMADFREIQLHLKLTYLEQQLAIAEQSVQASWQSMVKEDMLLSKIEALQNKLQTMLTSVQSQNKLGKGLDDQINSLRSELLNLHNAKEVYEKTAKETIKSLYEERLDYQNRIHMAEARCTSAEIECKRLNALVEELQKAIHDSNEKNCRQLLQLEESKQKHAEMNEKLLQINVEKMTMQQQLIDHRAKECQLAEQLQELNIELETKQLQLDSLHALQLEQGSRLAVKTAVDKPMMMMKMINQSNHLIQSLPVDNSNKTTTMDDESIPNQSEINNQSTSHLEELQNLQSSVEEMRKSQSELQLRLDEAKEEKSLLEKAMSELEDRHVQQSARLAVVEKEFLESQMKERVQMQQNRLLMETIDQLEKSLKDQQNGREADRLEKITLEQTVRCLNEVISEMKVKLSCCQKEMDDRERRIQEFENKFESMSQELADKRHRLNELEQHEDDLHVKMVVREVIDSVIDTIEHGDQEKQVWNTINVNPVQSKQLEIARIENESLKDELRDLREEFQNLSYQNKLANLFAVLPLSVLLASIIFAYMRVIDLFTGTKEGL